MRIRFHLLLAGAIFGAAVAGAAQTTPANFSIKIVARHDVVRTGSDVSVVVLLTNIANHELHYTTVDDDMFGDNGYVPKILDDAGKPVPLTKYGQMIANRTYLQGRRGQVGVQPGETTVPHEISLSELYDLTRPGKYTIQMERMDKDAKVRVKSNIITVTVTP
jgi:hypothetical protein